MKKKKSKGSVYVPVSTWAERGKITLCPHCFCMTKTIKGKCGKCKEKK